MDQAGFRLSPQQRRLWSLQGPQVGPYRAWCALLASGPDAASALRRAVAEAAARHEILRTRFRRLPELDVPLQLIDPDPGRAVSCELLQWDGREPEAVLELLLARARRAELDLERGPVLRAEIVPLPEERAAAVLVMPGLCCDARGLARLAAEIGQDVGGRAVAGPALQYADLAEWQEQLLAQEEAKAERSYWRARLPVRPPEPLLPCERPAAEVFAPRRLSLAPLPSAALRDAAESVGVTLAALVAACWQLLLWRLTGGVDAAVAHCFDGRSYEGLEESVGLLSRFLPVTCPVASGEGFATYARRVQEALEVAAGKQEYCDWPRPAGGRPGYPAYAFEVLPGYGGETLRLAALDACIERFRAKAVLRELEGTVELAYDASTLAGWGAAALAAMLHCLLRRVSADPQARVEELETLPEAESHRLLVELNDTRREPQRNESLHHLFARQAAAHPERAAVVCGDTELSFDRVERAANRLAHRLLAEGVGPEVPVPILLDRSAEVIEAILGVLKAGGAYVPLDPAQPRARLASILEELEAPVLITQASLAESVEGHRGRVLCLDGPVWPAIHPETDPGIGVAPEGLCSVLFTSGSTGKPKGVALEHRQVGHYLRGLLERLDLGEAASFATVSTFAADLGNTAVFPALATGACLHVVPQDLVLDPEGLAAYFGRHRIDCLKIVPSHLEALLAGGGVPLPRTHLVLGGELCRWTLVERLRDRGPTCRLFNHYGPTETTVGVTLCPIDGRAPEGDAVPLGRPNPNCQLYVLDPWQRPVPAGWAGELYIGGDGVSRGYFRSPAATAERFLPDPFGERPGGRLYRTGDRVRWLPAGRLEFLGRIDRQVKIRGYRIEPGEVEAAIARHPGVRQCAVVYRPGAAGSGKLLAYLVPRNGAAQDVDEVRRFLSQQLPDYMLPAAIAVLKALPLNGNGKVDLAALPEIAREAGEVGLVLPESEMEQAIAALWRELLDVDRVGVHDNFFDLGGHSLLMVQVHGRLREMFARKVSIVDLFRFPTVRAISDFLGRQEEQTPARDVFRRGERQREAIIRRQRRRTERKQ